MRLYFLKLFDDRRCLSDLGYCLARVKRLSLFRFTMILCWTGGLLQCVRVSLIRLGLGWKKKAIRTVTNFSKLSNLFIKKVFLRRVSASRKMQSVSYSSLSRDFFLRRLERSLAAQSSSGTLSCPSVACASGMSPNRTARPCVLK